MLNSFSSRLLLVFPLSILVVTVLIFQYIHIFVWQETDPALGFRSSQAHNTGKNFTDRFLAIENTLLGVSNALEHLKQQEDQFHNTHDLVAQAANLAAQSYEKKKDDVLHDVCIQLWRLQQTRARELVEEKRKESPPQQHVDNSKQPTGKDIVVLWGYTRNYPSQYPKSMFEQLTENRNQFCQSHGYTPMMVYFDDYIQPGYENIAKAWLKVFALQDAYNKHPEAKWFFWIDADAIIMNENIDLASHVLDPDVLRSITSHSSPLGEQGIRYRGKFSVSESDFKPEEVELIAAQDEWFLNAGIMLLKNTEFMKNMIDNEWLTEANLAQTDLVFAEQDSLNGIIMNNPEMLKRWAVIPQYIFNSYDYTYQFEPSRWREGDFIVHFPGGSVSSEYVSRWDNYWDLRIPAHVPNNTE